MQLACKTFTAYDPTSVRPINKKVCVLHFFIAYTLFCLAVPWIYNSDLSSVIKRKPALFFLCYPTLWRRAGWQQQTDHAKWKETDTQEPWQSKEVLAIRLWGEAAHKVWTRFSDDI